MHLYIGHVILSFSIEALSDIIYYVIQIAVDFLYIEILLYYIVSYCIVLYYIILLFWFDEKALIDPSTLLIIFKYTISSFPLLSNVVNDGSLV